MTPLVSVVVPTFRRPEVLPETLASLLRQDVPTEQVEVLVVDDGSGDATTEGVARVRAEDPRLQYLSQPNSGVARARNEGARRARGELLSFNDDDIVVEPDMVRQHLAVRAEYPNALVNGHWEFAPALAASLAETPFGRYRMQTESWVKTAVGMTPLKGNWSAPTGVTACNLGIRRDDFRRLGGFDEAFPHAGCEDQEFSLRAAAAGFSFVYSRDIRLWHNDHRMTLRQFGERQRRGAITAALLAVKHPELAADRPLIRENAPIGRGDGPRLALKKIAKQILAARPSLAVLLGATAAIERAWPRSPLLPRLYWTVYGLYIFRGVREGLRRYAGTETAARGSGGLLEPVGEPGKCTTEG